MLPQDLALARTSDLQGLGASARAPAYVPPAG